MLRENDPQVPGLNFAEKRYEQLRRTEVCVRDWLPPARVIPFSPPIFVELDKSYVKLKGNFLIVSYY